MSAVPAQKPIIVPRPARPQLRVEIGVQPSVKSKVFAKSALFAVLTLSFFFSSSLAGQVMVEKARRDGLHAVERARDASKETAILRDRVQDLTRGSAIDSWALENGFTTPELMAMQAKGKATDDPQ